ncbi:MAG: LCP family protein, partial [Coriobacteriia bacterium]|nr:LCP family protein [Coriobacteriia bacterium]
DFMRSINKEFQDDVVKDDKLAEVLTEPEPAKPFTILLLGSDVRPDEEAARTDTVIVAKVDPQAKRVWMISIPRDTRVEVPGYGVEKVNAANFHGGPALAVETVEKFLDVPINHYMEIDFEGFQSIVDALGGVYIDVDVEIDDWKAASHSKHHKASHIDPGYQLLDGEYALTYVRSRNFPDSDFTRMRHQQTFFKALAKQSTRWDNLFKLPGAIREFAKATTTDMSVGEMFGIASALRGLAEDSVQTATLVGEWRTPYIWTDEELKDRLVAAFKQGGDIETAKEPDQTTAIQPQDVTITVRNGGGISGIAAQCSDTLKAAGFDVRDVGNANQFVYDETLVVYREGDVAANAAAAALPAAKVISSRG